ncbi:unnamed protein product, partial [marine sediment metagenome]
MTDENRNWDLSFMYNSFDDPKIDEDIKQAEDLIENLTTYRGKIKTAEISAQELLEVIEVSEKIAGLVGKPVSYGMLLFAQETTNEDFKSIYSKMEKKSVEIRNKLLWIELEINAMSNETTEKYLTDPILVNYHHYIEVRRLNKPYVLSEEVEQVLGQKRLVGRDAWANFYNEFTAAFQFDIEIDGEKKKLSTGEIRPLFMDPNPEIREKVFKTYYQKYADNSIAVTHCYNNIWKNFGQNVKLRNYPTVMTAAHIR